VQDVGKKQVAAILGVQSCRTQTKPRPFLRLQTQRIAVQVPPPPFPPTFPFRILSAYFGGLHTYTNIRTQTKPRPFLRLQTQRIAVQEPLPPPPPPAGF